MTHNCSDEESTTNYENQGPLKIDWMKFSMSDCEYSIAIGELPGKKYKDYQRNLEKDLAELKAAGISHIYCLCSCQDLKIYRVPTLLQECVAHGFNLQHYPFEDGVVPDTGQVLTILKDIRSVLEHGNKAYIHCFDGFGSSCVVITCLAMYCDGTLTASDAINNIRMLRGPRAVQTVKQYNFINDFKELQRDYVSSDPLRRLSR